MCNLYYFFDFPVYFSSLQRQVEGSHGNDGLLLGQPLEEPDQPIVDKSLLEIVDGIVMMYNLSVHQQLGKVCLCDHQCSHMFFFLPVSALILHNQNLQLLYITCSTAKRTASSCNCTEP